MRLEASVIQHQIRNLIAQYPEIEEDEQLRADMIEGSTDTDDFLRMIERKRQEASSLAGAVASNIAELGLRQERFERREKAMRDLLMKILEAANLRKRELPEATLSLRAVAPKVVITDETALPDLACKFIRKPDLAKIKELLTDETGVCAGAEMSNGGTTISIRTK